MLSTSFCAQSGPQCRLGLQRKVGFHCVKIPRPVRCVRAEALRRTSWADQCAASSPRMTTSLTAMAACVIALVLGSGSAHAEYLLPPLPFEANATEPVIDAQTQAYHHDVHHAAYIKNLNVAVANDPALANLGLSELVAKVGTGTYPAKQETAIRNSGGGAWNHDLWWSILAPPSSNTTPTSRISPQLQQAMEASFGSVEACTKKLGERALLRFGSGWSWLAVQPDGGLFVVDLPNQDNPLMKLPGSQQGIPILAIDVWEHSYYLKYGPKRAAFVEAVPALINWAQVSQNYAAAVANNAAAVIGVWDTPA
ncbi:superoxidase dismutase [Haematococcus lacustris]